MINTGHNQTLDYNYLLCLVFVCPRSVVVPFYQDLGRFQFSHFPNQLSTKPIQSVTNFECYFGPRKITVICGHATTMLGYALTSDNHHHTLDICKMHPDFTLKTWSLKYENLCASKASLCLSTQWRVAICNTSKHSQVVHWVKQRFFLTGYFFS